MSETACGKNREHRHPPLSRAGFTLLELTIVMVIIALGIGIVLPRIPDIPGMRIERSARKVGMLVQLLRDRSVKLRRYYRLTVDIDESVFTAAYFGPEDQYVDDVDIKLLQLPENVSVVDLITSGGGKALDGLGEIHFSPRGMVEPSVIHLVDGKGRQLSVTPGILSGGFEINEGYEEFP